MAPRAARAALLASLALAAGCVTGARVEKARSLRDLGYAYFQEGNTGPAIEELRKSLRLNPRDAETHHKLALAYFARKLWDDADGAFRKATALRPSYPEAWLNWGGMKLAQEKWTDAIPLLTRAAEDPTYREPGRALHNIGWAWFMAGDLQKARESYQAVLKVTPLFCPSVLNLGQVAEAEGDLREAERLYRRACQCNKRDLGSLLSLGSVLLRLDHPDEARGLLLTVVQADPDGETGRKARQFLDGSP